MLADLRAIGVRVRLRPDRNVGLSAPAPPALVELARRHRTELKHLLASELQRAEPPPGVAAEWTDGLALLGRKPAPDSVLPDRWHLFVADVTWIVHQHGLELHRAGWDTLDLFGLHPSVPHARPDCMGLAWLLGGRCIETIVPKLVEIVAESGHVLRAPRLGEQARQLAVLGWRL